MFKFIAALTMCTFPFAAIATEWMEVSDNEETIVSVNTSDLRNQKIKNVNSVGAWVKKTYKVPKKNESIGINKPISEVMSMSWHQCQTRVVSDPIEIVFYGVNGDVLDTYSEEAGKVKFRHVTPDTVESNIQTVTCMIDMVSQMQKLEKGDSLSDYDYRRLEYEYPYEFKLMKDFSNSD